MRGRRAGCLAMAFAVLGTGAAEASQVGWTRLGLNSWGPVFQAAPWEGSTLTVVIREGGRLVILRDTTGVIGKNPPPGTSPCRIVSQHEARCEFLFVSDHVKVNFGDGPNTFRESPDPGVNTFFRINSGPGPDDIEVRSSAEVTDYGGRNRIVTRGSKWHRITAYAGVGSEIDTRDGAIDYVTCITGTGTDNLGVNFAAPIYQAGFLDFVKSDPIDEVDGCSNPVD